MVIGVIGVVICIVGAVISLDQFLRGYLIAYMFWLGLSLGCLGLLMVQYLVRRLLGLVRSGACWKPRAKCLPLMFVLFLPILILPRLIFMRG